MILYFILHQETQEETEKQLDLPPTWVEPIRISKTGILLIVFSSFQSQPAYCFKKLIFF